MEGKLVEQKTAVDRWGIWAILLLFLGLSFAYSVINPIHEATDELRHYRFVRTLATSGRLPIQGQEACRSQAHHPPLFYAIGALATAWIDTGRGVCDSPTENPFWAYRYWDVGRDNKNQYLHGEEEAFPWSSEALAVHIVRIVNILIGAGVVYLTWLTAQTIWPRQQGIALGSAALVAFNPMFLYMSGAINNDIIAALSGTAVMYACVVLLDNPARFSWRWGLIFGALYGISLMSKFNLAAIIILIEASITWATWKKPNDPVQSTKDGPDLPTLPKGEARKAHIRLWLAVNGILFVVAGLLAGWWFVRNQILFGEPTGFQQLTELWGVRNPVESLGLAISELPYAWTTLWGRFGFGQIPLPEAIYTGLKILTTIGLIGVVIGFIRRATFRERISLLILIANVGLFFLVLFNYMLVSPAGPNGRFFFPALSSFAVLIVYGLGQILLEILYWIKHGQLASETGEIEVGPGQVTFNLLSLTLTIGMLALSLLVLFNYLAPAYARPPSLTKGEVVPNRVDIQFDSLVTLLGYEITQMSALPGEPIDVDLYWEVNAQPPGNYLLFLHLMDEANTMVAQRDTHPGLGNFPSSLWRPGDRFVDSIRLYLPETVYTPATGRLNIGLYAPDAYRLTASDKENRPLGDAVQLGVVELRPSDGDFPNNQDQNFGDEMRLVGYQYDRRSAKPGEVIEVSLFWRSLRDLDKDYIVEVRLQAEDGGEWGWADGRPAGGMLPTETWNSEQIVEDLHGLTIDRGTPTGRYNVIISVRDVVTDQRLSIIAEDGHWIDTHLKLAQIWIE
ncbi:MAG TPA: phospholipid carrier-dependent glycosyltransferase [Patescibacteria group bacterium]|nr:phospholipid carrier-dependent glycosyltransferase [Patescibacteria group bacterium]